MEPLLCPQCPILNPVEMHLVSVIQAPTVIDGILRFARDCSPGEPTSTCRVHYSFVGWTFTDGVGIQVFIDDNGSHTDRVYTWAGSLRGSDAEDGIQGTQFKDTVDRSTDHLLEIVLQGGALLILDGVEGRAFVGTHVLLHSPPQIPVESRGGGP